ncbi:type IX secretion system motor protein PorL/GldL [Parafilimonas terrae]|uniref:Gliding motility-associated protein GldL n=1 Tax=Parafilimonas terrae TaxID=1465490 RepID=A0A1I5VKL7_9BACT|nr:gliding motility protein GldL [Parafilimonas terrae]SFQ08084.1 gliding motility-associated protein GldL [Parafilimonas terrae]
MAAAIPPKVSRVVDIFVSIAAAVVIWGALQKLLHTASADFFLKLGLGTEAAVFLVYGILYMYYPAIDDHQVKLAGAAAAVPQGNPALKTMEKMLEEADITPANLGKLSAGFQKLGTTVEKMGEISDVVKATGDYTQKTKEAAQALDAVKSAYSGMANSANSFNNASEGAKVFHEQIQVLTKNLSSLNTIYELELQESNNHLKALNQFYGKLNEASNAMNTTATDAIKAKEQIATLANNLGRLNQIYGNMISAMQGAKA